MVWCFHQAKKQTSSFWLYPALAQGYTLQVHESLFSEIANIVTNSWVFSLHPEMRQKLRMQVLYNSLPEILGGLLYNLSTPTVGSWGGEVSGYLQSLMATAMPDDEGDDGLTLL